MRDKLRTVLVVTELEDRSVPTAASRVLAGFSEVGNLAAANGKLFFSAKLSNTEGVAQKGRELWVSDGTMGGTYQVKDINVGAGDGQGSGKFFWRI